MRIRDRLSHAWNAFTSPKSESPVAPLSGYGLTSSGGGRPERHRSYITNDRSIVTSIYARLSIDTASIFLRHIKKDENGRYVSRVKSGLDECLNVAANLDQEGTQFRQDMALSLFELGVIAITPIDTATAPDESGNFDIRSLRVGEIVSWAPAHVTIRVYNEKTGRREELTVPKGIVAIVQNPLYTVMNEPNSILQRIIRKLQILDAVDEAAGSGKLDLLIQLPYTIRTESKMQQADNRQAQIEAQLKGSKYGIAYIDSTEKVTQLNRPAENNMLKQIEFLMGQLYGQLGLDESIFKGTADEATMLNYYNRTIEPVLRALTEAMSRTFLTKTARTQGHTIDYQREPFKLVPVKDLAEIADKFTRNEILSSNEVRSLIGFRPVDDPKADKLVNANMPEAGAGSASPPDTSAQDALVEETFASIEAAADDLIKQAGG